MFPVPCEERSVSSLYKLNSLAFGIVVVNLSPKKLLQALCQGSLSVHNLSILSLVKGTTISPGSIPAHY